MDLMTIINKIIFRLPENKGSLKRDYD